MFKLNIPERDRAYIYLALAAIGIVLLLSWGQLSFFNWNELNAPSVTSERTSYQRGGQDEGYAPAKRSARSGRTAGADKQSIRPKKGFIRSVKEAFEKYQERQYVEKLKRLARDTEDEGLKQEISAMLNEYYTAQESEALQESRYYGNAAERAAGLTPGYPRTEVQGKAIDPVSELEDYSGTSLMEMGRYSKQLGKPQLANKAFTYVVKNYSKRAGKFQAVPIVRKNTHAALEELAALRSARGEVFPPAKRGADDPLLELQDIVKKVLISMLRDRPKDLLPLISPRGIESGQEPGSLLITEHEHYSASAVYYELENKQGPHYEQLFGWVKRNHISPQNIRYWLTPVETFLFLVQIYYPEQDRVQKLYFKIENANWYLVFIGLD